MDTDINDLDGELVVAASKGQLANCRSLLKAGADVNFQNIVLETALHEAAQNGYVEVCRLLLDAGAAIEVKNIKKRTPLHNAAMMDHADVCRLLVERGAKKQPKEENGRTPLHMSTDNADAKACRYLVEAGAKVSIRDKYGYTALHDAALYNKVECCRILVEAGLSPSDPGNGKQDDWRTPFHRAVIFGKQDVVKYFVLECGEDLTQLTAQGKTLVEAAQGDAEMIATLHSLQTELMVRDAMSLTGVDNKRKARAEMGPL